MHPFFPTCTTPCSENWRSTDKLQLFSCNFGHARRSGPRTLASHLNGAWHVICVQGGAGCHRHLPGEEVVRGHPAPLCFSSRQGHCCTRLHVQANPRPLLASGTPCGPSRALLSLENSEEHPTRRAPTSRLPTSTTTTTSKKRRSVCTAFFFLVPDFCLC